MPAARRASCARKRAAIVHHKPALHRETKSQLANQRRRFAQKTGFGERRCDAKPVSTKIFLLPKTATQSPRNGLLGGPDRSRSHRLPADRSMSE
jgi:hypothetical protein